MNLIWRLLWLLLAARFRARVPILGSCVTPFRCVLTDLDVLRHMNNGKYLSIMDLARVDLMIRSGLDRTLRRAGYYPVVVAQTIRYRKSIALFETFTIETQVLGWDDKAFLVAQRFLRDGACVAEAIVRARFLKRSGGSVSPVEILRLAGHSGQSPPVDSWVSEWNGRQAA